MSAKKNSIAKQLDALRDAHATTLTELNVRLDEVKALKANRVLPEELAASRKDVSQLTIDLFNAKRDATMRIDAHLKTKEERDNWERKYRDAERERSEVATNYHDSQFTIAELRAAIREILTGIVGVRAK